VHLIMWVHCYCFFVSHNHLVFVAVNADSSARQSAC
jgi:hypothetical protein